MVIEGISKLKLIRNSLIYAILPKLASVSFFFILPIVSNYLVIEDYAVYGLISAYLLIFQFTTILGQNVVLQNSYFDYGKKFHLVWSRAFGIMTISGVLSSIFLSIILYFALNDIVESDLWIILISVSIFLIASPIDSIASLYFVLNERPLPFSFISILNGLLTSFVFYWVVGVLKWGYLGWVLMWPISSIFSLLVYGTILFRESRIYPNFKFSFRFLKESLKLGLPITPHQISLMVLNSSDRIILQYFGVPISKIGVYTQGYTFGSYASFLVNGIFQAMTKNIQIAFRNIEERANRIYLKKIFHISTFIISISLFWFSLFSREVFIFFFKKPELQAAYTITIVVFSSYMFWALYSLFTYPLLIFKKTKQIMLISGIAAAVNIAGNFILIPRFGINASAFMTYLSYVLFGILGLFNKENRNFLSKIINVRFYTICFTLLNISLFLCSFALRDFELYIKLTLLLFFFILSISYFIYNSQRKIIETLIL